MQIYYSNLIYLKLKKQKKYLGGGCAAAGSRRRYTTAAARRQGLGAAMRWQWQQAEVQRPAVASIKRRVVVRQALCVRA
jgi:hypothetical protein